MKIVTPDFMNMANHIIYFSYSIDRRSIMAHINRWWWIPNYILPLALINITFSTCHMPNEEMAYWLPWFVASPISPLLCEMMYCRHISRSIFSFTIIPFCFWSSSYRNLFTKATRHGIITLNLLILWHLLEKMCLGNSQYLLEHNKVSWNEFFIIDYV